MSGEWLEGTIESRVSEALSQCGRSADEDTNETILLVEDELRVRRVMTDVLRLKGYKVLEAEDAEQAIQMARESGHHVDLLVTDVALPGKSGRDLARELRRRLPGLKTILVSGYGESVALLGNDCGAKTHYLPKPFSVTSLLGAVESALSEGKAKCL
jgi:two-component system cell cycle sensor histidine kinase/response regulator CckA